jgi:hypothetical protein
MSFCIAGYALPEWNEIGDEYGVHRIACLPARCSN